MPSSRETAEGAVGPSIRHETFVLNTPGSARRVSFVHPYGSTTCCSDWGEGCDWRLTLACSVRSG